MSRHCEDPLSEGTYVSKRVLRGSPRPLLFPWYLGLVDAGTAPGNRQEANLTDWHECRQGRKLSIWLGTPGLEFLSEGVDRKMHAGAPLLRGLLTELDVSEGSAETIHF